MKTVLEIYKEHKVFSILQLHQLRVAAIGSQICDSLSVPVDKKSVVEALLFHDMGNLVKVANFDLFPESWEPEGVEYWKQVKEEQIEIYGDDAHVVTEAMAEQIAISHVAKDMIKRVGFSQAKTIQECGSLENKICSYADQRVSPKGVLSLLERVGEGAKRNDEGHTKKAKHFKDGDERDAIVQALIEMEAEIFSHSSITPSDINDESIAPTIEELKAAQIG